MNNLSNPCKLSLNEFNCDLEDGAFIGLVKTRENKKNKLKIRILILIKKDSENVKSQSN